MHDSTIRFFKITWRLAAGREASQLNCVVIFVLLTHIVDRKIVHSLRERYCIVGQSGVESSLNTVKSVSV